MTTTITTPNPNISLSKALKMLALAIGVLVTAVASPILLGALILGVGGEVESSVTALASSEFR